jgi:hypothetical protein
MCNFMRPQHLLILFVIFFIAHSTYCQPVFKNDTAFHPFLQTIVTEIDSNYHLQKNADFEMRFWTWISKTMERRLFILSLNSGKWTARLFKKTSFLKDTLFEIPVVQNNLEQLWKKLNKYNLLIIPNEYDLRNKNGNEINNPVHDGISYWFEFITNNNKGAIAIIARKVPARTTNT